MADALPALKNFFNVFPSYGGRPSVDRYFGYTLTGDRGGLVRLAPGSGFTSKLLGSTRLLFRRSQIGVNRFDTNYLATSSAHRGINERNPSVYR